MQRIIEKFKWHFNSEPVAAAQAPGRLEVLGNHTDYNEGTVLSCAVEQTTRFFLAPTAGNKCTVYDGRDRREMVFRLEDLDKKPPRGGIKYIIGMLKQLQKRGLTPFAFNAYLESNVPLSAGMSSSAALEVACGMAISAAAGFEISRADLARAGQAVENDYLGLKSGLLDQFSSLFGKKDTIIKSDFRTVSVSGELSMPPGYVFVVVNSMKKHHLVDSDYNLRREDCENAAKKLSAVYPECRTLRDVLPEQLENAKSILSNREFLRASHIVGECCRVEKASELLAAGDVCGFGKLLFGSHDSSMKNFENSTEELDVLINIARQDEACLGARLSGGGFGGITIHLVKACDARDYARRVCDAYKKICGIDAEYFICSLGDGAQILI